MLKLGDGNGPQGRKEGVSPRQADDEGVVLDGALGERTATNVNRRAFTSCQAPVLLELLLFLPKCWNRLIRNPPHLVNKTRAVEDGGSAGALTLIPTWSIIPSSQQLPSDLKRNIGYIPSCT